MNGNYKLADNNLPLLTSNKSIKNLKKNFKKSLKENSFSYGLGKKFELEFSVFLMELEPKVISEKPFSIKLRNALTQLLCY